MVVVWDTHTDRDAVGVNLPPSAPSSRQNERQTLGAARHPRRPSSNSGGLLLALGNAATGALMSIGGAEVRGYLKARWASEFPLTESVCTHIVAVIATANLRCAPVPNLESDGRIAK